MANCGCFRQKGSALQGGLGNAIANANRETIREARRALGRTQRGPFPPDGIIAGLLPLTTVIWILAPAATLPRSRRAAATAAFGTGG